MIRGEKVVMLRRWEPASGRFHPLGLDPAPPRRRFLRHGDALGLIERALHHARMPLRAVLAAQQAVGTIVVVPAIVALLLQPSAGVAVVRHAPVTMMGTRPRKSVAVNRLARRNYEILDEFEAGVALVGTEVKSCRAGKVTLRDGYCRIDDGECWLHNVNIARHETAGAYFQHEETRPRRLLLHKREIRKLEDAVNQKGLTIVPLAAYFNEKSYLKVSIGLARGKKLQDKREDLKRRDQQRETARVLKAFR